MKKYSTLLTVVITILFIGLLTWILPITYFNGELVEAERVPLGLADLFEYPNLTFFNFIYVFLYLIGIGGLYGLLNKIGAYRTILDKVSARVKKKGLLYLILTVLILTTIVSFTGFTFEALIVLPFIAGVILLLGYDKMTAAMVTVGSVSVGIIGTTFSNLVAGNFNKILNTNYTDLIIVKVALLLVCAALLIFNIVRHTKKIEKVKNPEESFLLPAKEKGKKAKVWPLATILICFLLVITLGSINWSEGLKVSFFDDMHNTIMGWHVLSKYVWLPISILVITYNFIKSLLAKKKAKKNDKFMSKRRLIVTIVFGVVLLISLLKIVLEDVFNVTNIMTQALETIKLTGIINSFTFSKLLGNATALGSWSYSDYFAVMVIVFLTIKFVYRIKFSDMLDNIGEGFKYTLYAAMVCILTYTVLLITSGHPVILTILKPLLGLTDGLSILWYPLSTFVSALCNTDFTYYQYSVLNLTYATSYFTSASVYPLCGLITQAMYGLALMVAPTSVVLLFSLSVLEIRYTEWLKKMWLPILEIVLVIFISFIIVLQFLV